MFLLPWNYGILILYTTFIYFTYLFMTPHLYLLLFGEIVILQSDPICLCVHFRGKSPKYNVFGS